MTQDWDWKGNFPISKIPKGVNAQTDTPVPLVERGALYAGAPKDDNIYLYGGTTSYQNTSFPGYEWPGSALYSLWSFDTVLRTWNLYSNQEVCSDAPNRPNAGAWDAAPDQGLAFYFNGQIDSGSSITTQDLRSDSYSLDGMIVIDTNAQTARNLSTESVVQGAPRTRGKMTYIANVGTYGILVLLGGTSQSLQNSSDEGTGNLVREDLSLCCSCE